MTQRQKVSGMVRLRIQIRTLLSQDAFKVDNASREGNGSQAVHTPAHGIVTPGTAFYPVTPQNGIQSDQITLVSPRYGASQILYQFAMIVAPELSIRRLGKLIQRQFSRLYSGSLIVDAIRDGSNSDISHKYLVSQFFKDDALVLVIGNVEQPVKRDRKRSRESRGKEKHKKRKRISFDSEDENVLSITRDVALPPREVKSAINEFTDKNEKYLPVQEQVKEIPENEESEKEPKKDVENEESENEESEKEQEAEVSQDEESEGKTDSESQVESNDEEMAPSPMISTVTQPLISECKVVVEIDNKADVNKDEIDPKRNEGESESDSGAESDSESDNASESDRDSDDEPKATQSLPTTALDTVNETNVRTGDSNLQQVDLSEESDSSSSSESDKESAASSDSDETESEESDSSSNDETNAPPAVMLTNPVQNNKPEVITLDSTDSSSSEESSDDEIMEIEPQSFISQGSEVFGFSQSTQDPIYIPLTDPAYIPLPVNNRDSSEGESSDEESDEDSESDAETCAPLLDRINMKKAPELTSTPLVKPVSIPLPINTPSVSSSSEESSSDEEIDLKTRPRRNRYTSALFAKR